MENRLINIKDSFYINNKHNFITNTNHELHLLLSTLTNRLLNLLNLKNKHRPSSGSPIVC